MTARTMIKVRRFLIERKAPVTVKEIADYFLLSEASVRKALNDLKEEKQADFQYFKNKTGGRVAKWTIVRKAAPVAIPNFTAHTVRTAPAGSSYPNIRGYDD